MVVALAAFVGAFSWTFLEYVIHRFAGHDKRLPRNPFGVEHTRHHAEGGYFAHWSKKLAMAVVVAAALVTPLSLLLPWTVATAFTLGLIGSYLTYESIHWSLHVFAPMTPYGRWARRHHFHHHFHDPRRNHGVTSPLWDWVFGTVAKPGVVRVPERLAMRWLVDEAGALHPKAVGDFELRRRPRASRPPLQ